MSGITWALFDKSISPLPDQAISSTIWSLTAVTFIPSLCYNRAFFTLVKTAGIAVAYTDCVCCSLKMLQYSWVCVLFICSWSSDRLHCQQHCLGDGLPGKGVAIILMNASNVQKSNFQICATFKGSTQPHALA